MRKSALRIAAVVCAVSIGFLLGRITKPTTVRAAGAASRIVRVQVSDAWAVIPGWGNGTATGISCIPAAAGGDCYVVLQGN